MFKMLGNRYRVYKSDKLSEDICSVTEIPQFTLRIQTFYQTLDTDV